MINLKELNKKSYLQALILDKQKLQETIKATQGYVLQLMDSHQVVPPRDFLVPDLEEVPVYTLNFLVKNYTFEKEEIKQLRKYFKYKHTKQVVDIDDENEPEIEENITPGLGQPILSAVQEFVKEKLTHAEIIEYLTSGLKVPDNTIYPLDILNQYSKEIIDTYSQDEYAAERVISASLNLLTLEEFLSVPAQILSSNPNLFNKYALAHNWSVNDYQNHDVFRNMYLKYAFAKGQRIRQEDFRLCGIKETEKEFFLSLMPRFQKSFSAQSYEKLSTIPGLTKVLSKLDYLSLAPEIIGEFSAQEIKENPALYQKPWRDYLEKEKSYYSRFSFFRNIEDPQVFDAFLTQDFFNDLMGMEKAYRFETPEGDKSQADNDKKLILNKRFVEYFLQKIASMPFNHDLVRELDMFSTTFLHVLEAQAPRYNTTEEELKENSAYQKSVYERVVKNLLPQITQTNWVLDTQRETEFYSTNILDFLNEYALKNPSLNLLYHLLSVDSNLKNSRNYGTRLERDSYEFKLEIKKLVWFVASSVDKTKSEQLLKYFNFGFKDNGPEVKEIKKQAKKLSRQPLGDIDYNFLNYESSPHVVKNMSSKMIQTLYSIDSRFPQFLLKNKIPVATYFLRQLMDNDTSVDTKFVKDYISLHKKDLSQNEEFLKMIADHPKGHTFYQIDTKEQDEKIWSTYMAQKKELLAQLEKAPEYKEKDDYYGETEKEKPPTKRDICYKISDLTSSLLKEASFSFIKSKVAAALEAEDYEIVSVAMKGSKESAQLVYDKIGAMSYEKIMHNLDNSNFRDIVANSVDYEGNSSISLSGFTSEQNYALTKKMQKKIEKFSVKEDSYRNYVFSLFSESSIDFIRQYVINEIPLKMFYGYDFRAGERSYSNKKLYIKEPFSAQEILQAYLNAEKQGSIFSSSDRNAKIDNFISDNFKKSVPEYLKLLDMTKTAYPKFYLTLLSSAMLETLSQWKIEQENPERAAKLKDYGSGEKMTRDEHGLNGLRHFFDINALCEGIKIVNEEALRQKNQRHLDNGYNEELAAAAISTFLYNTYGDKPDTQNEKISCLTKEESHKVIKTLCDIAPIYMIDRYALGCVFNVSEEVKENFTSFFPLEFDTIDKVLYYGDKIKPSNFSGRDSEHNVKAAVDVVSGMIQAFVNNEKIEEVNYLSYILELDNFVEKQVSYDYQFDMRSTYDSLIPLIQKSKEIAQKLEVYNTKFFLNNMLENQIGLTSTPEENKETTKKKRNKI